jgi:hypothetical protein
METGDHESHGRGGDALRLVPQRVDLDRHSIGSQRRRDAWGL